jgi:CheY-like chemotaxis protein
MAVNEPASSGIPGQFVPTDEPVARWPNLRILLVDDNALNLSAGQAMMSRFGHQIDTAANGVEAIQAVVGGGYDLVLMDVRMPGMDGPETADRIRRLDLRQPRIIALTASASAKDRSACRNAGMDGYLLKPLRSPALVELLDQEQQIAGTVGPGPKNDAARMLAHRKSG